MSLLNRLIDYFPSGEMAFNSYTSFAVWASKHVLRHILGLRLLVSRRRRPQGTRTPNPKLKRTRKSSSPGNPRSPSISTAARPLQLADGDKQHNPVPIGTIVPNLPSFKNRRSLPCAVRHRP